jgi:prevent-host-death family protein
VESVTRIPQRELRNNVSEVLRRAERGERLTITVAGRPVAELGPVSGTARLAAPDRLRAILEDAPVDATWPADLERMRREEDAAGGESERG